MCIRDSGWRVSQSEAQVQFTPKVRWGRVALFYGLAFGWVCLVAGALFVLGQRNLSGAAGPTVVTTVLALLYMPAPLVAALIVEPVSYTHLTGGWRSPFRRPGRESADPGAVPPPPRFRTSSAGPDPERGDR